MKAALPCSLVLSLCLFLFFPAAADAFFSRADKNKTGPLTRILHKKMATLAVFC